MFRCLSDLRCFDHRVVHVRKRYLLEDTSLLAGAGLVSSVAGMSAEGWGAAFISKSADGKQCDVVYRRDGNPLERLIDVARELAPGSCA